MCTETKDARVHCTILNDHTNQHPTPSNTTRRALTVPETTTTGPKTSTLSSQDPTVCRPPPTNNQQGTSGVSTFLEQPHSHDPDHKSGPGTRGPPPPTGNAQDTRPRTTPERQCSVKLLRKEVIQPHLPVRLPCYDFVPIASPTFDRSPPYGLGHGLRVLPTFVT
jgi:hypothetical protein